MLTDEMGEELQALGYGDANIARNGGVLIEPLRSHMASAAKRARAAGATLGEIRARLNVSSVLLGRLLLGAQGTAGHVMPVHQRTHDSGGGVGIGRAGTRPRSVEVGMVLCRPADGACANSWRVKSMAGPDARVRRLDAVDDDIGLPVAIAAILHESGGWVLAEDWTAVAEGEATR